ncbi:head-tail adaptor [Marinomonas phage CB5A]|uniref:Collar/head-to-tail joining protein n=3 Tax=Murciavirus TaxID=2731675 RepID=A0A1W5S628_9CAUD|nr:head-tail adaptor [Marinomonas phage CPP1m]YP_009791124.1 head-tail adaptor [Marinomonas phage CB5A]ARB11251.1 collar/head-to-tail joining protein [Marinomonas phage CPP1m]ARB11301.1 collar/head-to-tail joining protein [Marinomonas phage CPG1g]ASP46281.1 collar head to tail joining protein [Marinomonas phage CB5A]
MANGYKPEVIQSEPYLDLTKDSKVHKRRPKDDKTIENRYKKLSAKREPFLERARAFSNYTIPNLYPLSFEGDNQGDGTEQTGWQSIGAQCVSNLTNKLVMTLFPPHSTFARLEITPEAKKVLREEDINEIEQSKSLVNVEKEAMLEHERIAGRVAIGEAAKHLLVGGTTCLYMPKEGNLINYPMTRFVNRRDKSGKLLELITEEEKALDTFDEETQAVLKRSPMYDPSKDSNVRLYTKVSLKKGMYFIEQEAYGVQIGKSYRVTEENNPFLVLRWESNYGEDYGRSLVEQFAGDFHAVQFLSEAIAKGMILMADIKYLVKAGATTDVDHLINSPTGEFVTGNLDDIGVLQLEKYADFTPIASVLDKYERRVGSAFLLGRAVQRDAERVTQAEIRRDAIEMEQSLGGAYSLLANTLQRPYFRLLLNRINFELPERLVSTVLLTGIEALSKLSDADKYEQWSIAMQQGAALPEPIQAYVKWRDFATYHANQLSYDLPFLMTEEEYGEKMKAMKEQQQQQAIQEAGVKAAPQMAGAIMKQE